MATKPYDYSDSGFDGFLSRSIDELSQVNLDSAGPKSTAIRFDASQVSGAVGDTFRVGKIFINGADGNIVGNDGNVDFFLIGNDG